MKPAKAMVSDGASISTIKPIGELNFGSPDPYYGNLADLVKARAEQDYERNGGRAAHRSGDHGSTESSGTKAPEPASASESKSEVVASAATAPASSPTAEEVATLSHTGVSGCSRGWDGGRGSGR